MVNNAISQNHEFLSDQERQEDELFALQNIYDASEFRYKKKANIECLFSISCCFIANKLLIETNTYFNGMTKKLYIKHLPHVRLYVRLPKNYPSVSAPQYFLAINWLPPWEVSLACQKLDELLEENKHNEILFIWTEFLKNELLNYLNLTDVLDVSYFFELFKNPTDKYLLEVLRWADDRIVYGGLYLNPVERLLDYDEYENLVEFENNIHECGICFLAYYGKMCIKVNLCNHIFCKDCVTQFLKTMIDQHNVSSIKCPAFGCKIYLNYNQIEGVCSSDLFEKYVKYLTELTLLNSKKVVYCPRKICNSLAIIKDDGSLASCPECEYNFCTYCFKVYHGIVPCDMSSSEKLKLIEEYENGNKMTKKILEKKYGKKQIQQIVEKELTNNYLKQNAKACPTCKTMTAKISGCNLMDCLHCHTNFCWICNSKIMSEDPYDHFKSTKNGFCQGLLFQGVDESEETNNAIDMMENIDIMENINIMENIDLMENIDVMENIEALLINDFD